jgi:hypothetical protein
MRVPVRPRPALQWIARPPVSLSAKFRNLSTYQRLLRQCLYFCTSKASKLSAKLQFNPKHMKQCNEKNVMPNEREIGSKKVLRCFMCIVFTSNAILDKQCLAVKDYKTRTSCKLEQSSRVKC